MKKHYIEERVLLRKNMKMSVINREVSKNKYLVSYYDEDNKLKYDIITEDDIIDEKEYDIIRNRINTINKLFE